MLGVRLLPINKSFFLKYIMKFHSILIPKMGFNTLVCGQKSAQLSSRTWVKNVTTQGCRDAGKQGSTSGRVTDNDTGELDETLNVLRLFLDALASLGTLT